MNIAFIIRLILWHPAAQGERPEFMNLGVNARSKQKDVQTNIKASRFPHGMENDMPYKQVTKEKGKGRRKEDRERKKFPFPTEGWKEGWMDGWKDGRKEGRKKVCERSPPPQSLPPLFTTAWPLRLDKKPKRTWDRQSPYRRKKDYIKVGNSRSRNCDAHSSNASSYVTRRSTTNHVSNSRRRGRWFGRQRK
jgi:hypothetical protein